MPGVPEHKVKTIFRDTPFGLKKRLSQKIFYKDRKLPRTPLFNKSIPVYLSVAVKTTFYFVPL